MAAKRLINAPKYLAAARRGWLPKYILCSWIQANQFKIKINYLYILTSPLEQKIYADSESGLKKFHIIPEGQKTLIEFSGGMTIQIFKIV